MATNPTCDARYKVRLTNGRTHTALAATLDGALALARAFEVEQAGNPDAYTTIHELDGTNAGFGTCVHRRWMGEKFGPRDTRHPMQVLFRKAVQSGARVTLIDELGTWQFNDDTAAVSYLEAAE